MVMGHEIRRFRRKMQLSGRLQLRLREPFHLRHECHEGLWRVQARRFADAGDK